MARIVGRIKTFAIVLPHVRSEYEALKRIGDYIKVDEGKYEWTFPIGKVQEVEVALGGKVIEFDKEHLLKDVISHCDPVIRELSIEKNTKGKGEIIILVEDMAYRVNWYEQGKEKTMLVAKSLVEHIWFNAMDVMKVNDPTEGNKVAEKIVKSLEKHHWDRGESLFIDPQDEKMARERIESEAWKYEKSKEFSWKYFYGDRGHYLKLYNNVLKAMMGLGLVKHTRHGLVIKLCKTEDFTEQTKFGEKKLYEDEVERELQAELPPNDRGNILKWAEKMR